MTETGRESHQNDERRRLEGRIQELFEDWKRDPSNFTFCQTVRTVDNFSFSRGPGPSIDDGSAMMEAIAERVCGGRWEYVVHSTFGGNPVCIITGYVGDRHE